MLSAFPFFPQGNAASMINQTSAFACTSQLTAGMLSDAAAHFFNAPAVDENLNVS
jgi:hypothetical protein